MAFTGSVSVTGPAGSVLAVVGNMTMSVPTGGITSQLLDVASTSASAYAMFPLRFMIGHSGGDYPIIGYNIVATSTAGTYNYNATAVASALQFQAGGFNFMQAVSGTTGTAITFTTPLAISPAGSSSFALPASGTAAAVILPASSATIPALRITAGTILTSAVAGVREYDGTNSYMTNETTSGRGLIPVEQYFHLTAAGTGITTIANFFGTTSNISLVANAYYEIEIVAWFTMGATGSVITWTLTNSAAPTYMDLYYEMSPVTGIVAPPGTATKLVGQILGGVTAAQTVVTASLTASSQQYARFRIQLKNGTGTSLKIQVAETTTTTSLTPNIGSFWRCKRIPAANVGTFAA
jgi:hypothetical protein